MNTWDKHNIRGILEGYFDSLLPPPPMRVSTWAETTRRLSLEGSAEAGLWKNRPFQAEILDTLGPESPYQQVVLMVASQILKTETCLNFLAYIIDRDPGPCLIVEPRVEDAKALSKDRVAPMIRDTPELKRKMTSADSHTGPVGNTRSNNTTLHKKFMHGHVTFTGASKPSGLAMRPIRYLMLDEIDRYPPTAGREGDPCMLAVRRTDEFYWSKKILMCSTPTIEGFSRISHAYDESDQRRPHVPCPFCGEYQELEFFHLEWDEAKPQTAKYRCDFCGKHIPPSHKDWMLAHGRWHARNPQSKIAGFWLNQLYSTRRSWGDIAEEYVMAKKQPETHRVFINTVLALTWKEKGEAPDWRKLYDRAEKYPLRTIPAGGVFLTAGVDVQEDRLEIMVTAWGRDRENWLVDYVVLMGNVHLTAKYLEPDGTPRESVWDRLANLLNGTYRHETAPREIGIKCMAIDSGYATQEVYDWARRMRDPRIMVVRGYDTGPFVCHQPIPVDVNFRGKKIKRGVRMWQVNVSMFKDELYNRLRLDPPTAESREPYPPGYCHFPQMGEGFFKQLTAEQLETIVSRQGYQRQQWSKHGANEALDCKNYARAAAYNLGMDNYKEKDWRARERAIGLRTDAPPSPALAPLPEEPPPPGPVPAQPAAQPFSRPRRSRMIPPNWHESGW